ncbi:hypothetical protein HanRHA438_Chr11g0520391 [Helianthus annuus]|nr:hypothetical protein HanIR_Chr11g0546401 [Helianthus annuus]KAJ0872140.1 hypothetical protein HanRHA438_Chr11g0520391 [Helianthus annuus]
MDLVLRFKLVFILSIPRFFEQQPARTPLSQYSGNSFSGQGIENTRKKRRRPDLS